MILHAEFNTWITFVGMICATVQGFTGIYAGYIRKRTGLLKTSAVLAQPHRVFCNYATILYFLGLFAGLVGFIGAITRNTPPFELDGASFNSHTWGSFLVLIIFIWKTWLSYFQKNPSTGRRDSWELHCFWPGHSPGLLRQSPITWEPYPTTCSIHPRYFYSPFA